MKNYTNIYDIDGNIIRAAGDNHKITLEEAQKMIDSYKEKLQNCDKNDPKTSVYRTYITNLTHYVVKQYENIPYDKLVEMFASKPKETPLNEQINNAMNDLKEQVEAEQKETVMDEYVDFEEIK